MALDRDKLRNYVLVTGAEELPEDDGILRYYRDFLNDILAISDDLQNQYKRRALVKSASAAFESSAFELWEQLKKVAKLSDEAKWILKETNVTLADNGEIKARKAIHTLPVRLKFAFLQINTTLEDVAKFNITNKFWNLLQEFQLTRNKLLHPNSKEVPLLTDEQIEELIELAGYVFAIIHLCMCGVSWEIGKNNKYPSNVFQHKKRMSLVAVGYSTSFNFLKSNSIIIEADLSKTETNRPS